MHQRSLGGWRPLAVRGSATLVTAVLGLGLMHPNAGAVEQPGFPSRSDVADAQRRVDSTERSVESIKAELTAAGARLDQLSSKAARAFDAYYAAMEEFQQSRQEAKEARRKAERYAGKLDRQGDRMGALVADTYQSAGSLGQLRAYLVAEDPERLLSRVSAYNGASDSMSSHFDVLAAERAIAEVYQTEAAQSARSAEDAAAEAERVRADAQRAVTAQQSALATMGQRRDALLRELAEAQNISVELATERQEALDRIEAERRAQARRERAEAEARRQAELAAQREAERRAELAARREAERKAEMVAERRADRRADLAAEHRAERQAERAARREAERRAERAAERKAERQARRAARREAEREAAREARADAGREARADAAPSRSHRPRRPAAPTSNVVVPLPATASFYNQDSFGNCSSLWSNCHTGNDFSASCGMPVLASNSGTVNVRTDQSWSGNWLVEVIGRDGVVTWYAHMQSLSTYDGQTVVAGQQIGAVGTLGNSTGCHLHFEVRPGGGNPIDPVDWLAQHGVYI